MFETSVQTESEQIIEANEHEAENSATNSKNTTL